jgi:hypothetical protein
MSFAENNSIFAILPKSSLNEMGQRWIQKKSLPAKKGDSQFQLLACLEALIVRK